MSNTLLKRFTMLFSACAATAVMAGSVTLHGFQFDQQEGVTLFGDWILINVSDHFELIKVDQSRPASFFHMLSAFKDKTVWQEYKSIRIGYEFRCETNEVRQTTYNAYTDYFGQGEPQEKKANTKWQKATPGTLVSEVIKMSCEQPK